MMPRTGGPEFLLNPRQAGRQWWIFSRCRTGGGSASGLSALRTAGDTVVASGGLPTAARVLLERRRARGRG